jgi:hypothetical protein
MRIRFETVAILERARLAFIGIHHGEARRRLGAHELPFAG